MILSHTTEQSKLSQLIPDQKLDSITIKNSSQVEPNRSEPIESLLWPHEKKFHDDKYFI